MSRWTGFALRRLMQVDRAGLARRDGVRMGERDSASNGHSQLVLLLLSNADP